MIRAMLCVVALALSAGDACAATQTTDYCLTETLDGDLGDFIMKARLMIAGHHFVLDAWNIMLDNPQTLEIHADGTYRQNGPTPIRFIDNWENRGRGTFTATKSKLQIDIDTVTTSPGGANIGRNYGAYDLKSHRCKWGGQ